MQMKPTFVLFSLLAAGCVTTKFHEQQLAEAERLRAAQEKAGADREAKLKDQIAELEHKLADTQAKLDKTVAERDALRKQADDLTALTEQLKGRLEKLGQNVDKLTSEKGHLAAGLDDAKNRLEELRKQKAAAEARAALFNEFVSKFRKMIDAGRVTIRVRRGRIVLSLHNDVLFDEGKTDLKPEGKEALKEIAQALRTVGGRSFQVAGHTDNLPIKSAQFPSNWELSTARSVVVLKFLVQQGVNSGVLSAAGYGEFDPVASNGDVPSRSKNRRIEISLVPNIEELISLPELKGGGDSLKP
jgi:chemotaxis protein MotB